MKGATAFIQSDMFLDAKLCSPSASGVLLLLHHNKHIPIHTTPTGCSAHAGDALKGKTPELPGAQGFAHDRATATRVEAIAIRLEAIAINNSKDD